MLKIRTELQNHLEENINIHKDILKMSKDIIDVIESIKKKLKKGGKIMFCGNGGSAADAQHLTAEFIIRLRPHINRKPIPALTLTQDTSTLTACGNDYSFDDIFLRPFQALAKKKKIYSICFLGKGGGKAKKMSSKSLVISSYNTARIQECHIFLGHFILEKVEDFITSKKKVNRFGSS